MTWREEAAAIIADALADTLYSMDGLQSIDCEMRDNAVQQHRARRQG